MPAGTPAHGARSRVLALAAAAGVASGFGSGLKLSAFPFTVATVLAFFVISLPFLRRLALAFACGCGALVGLLISYGWWALRARGALGKPTAALPKPALRLAVGTPLLEHRCQTPAARRAAGPLLPLPLDQPAAANKSADIPRAVDARSGTGPVAARPPKESPCSPAGVPGARSSPPTPSVSSSLLTIVTYLIWVDVFAIYRYLVPLEMLSFVILGVCLRRLFSPLKPWPIAAGLLAAVVIASLVTEQTDNIGRTAWASRYITVLIPASIPSRAAFLMIGTNPDAYVVPYFPSDDFFARIQGNIRPTPTAEARIKKDLRSYSNVYVFWVDPNQYPSDAALLAQAGPPWGDYGFTVNTSACVGDPDQDRHGRSVRARLPARALLNEALVPGPDRSPRPFASA